MDIFKIKENQTSIKTEILSGVTIFFTMLYLFILSPRLLEAAGTDFSSAFTSTVITAFTGCSLMAFIANKPYAAAPLLGETAFIVYTITLNSGFSFAASLCAVFICGILLLIMSLTNLRGYIIKQIPQNIKISYCTGLGLFFIFTALKDMGIVNFTQKTVPLETGLIFSFPAAAGILCFLMIIILTHKKVKAAVLIAILITSVSGVIFNDIHLPAQAVSMPSHPLPPFILQDFSEIFQKNFIPIFFLIFMLVNIDTSGALITLGYAQNKNNTDRKTMLSDSLAVIAAPFLGAATPGACIESITGIKSGGKTGLCAITAGLLFLFLLPFTPLITVIPSYAYAPALLYIGILLASEIKNIDLNDITQYAPAILTVSIMVFTYNIGFGILSAFITYPLIKALTGKISEINTVTRILFIISLVFFIIYPY